MKKLSDIKEAAQKFANKWKNRGGEIQDSQTFIEDLLEDVFGIDDARHQIDVQKAVHFPEHKKFSDIYIRLSKTVVEMKSHDIDLNKEEKQSDGSMLTPLLQGKRYYDWLNKQEQGNYVVACNFQQFLIMDMRHKNNPPTVINLEELPKRISKLIFIAEPDSDETDYEEPISRKASEYVKSLYQLLRKANPNADSQVKHSINVFCVRVVFCLYAEDSGIFDDAQFHHYIQSSKVENLSDDFDKLFNWLDDEKRAGAKYASKELKAFPYVDGGLFQKDENYCTPNLNQKIKNHLLEAWDLKLDDKKEFHWGEISPTNFGGIFESTVDSNVREQGGMHYTTPSNIHKLIDPLFIDDLKKELYSLLQRQCSTKQEREKLKDDIEAFRKEMASIRVLDPACGSGNFLTETYKSLHDLELQAIHKEVENNIYDPTMPNTDPCMVNIDQFYGIEIEDFATQVARAALWIAECQMYQKSQEFLDFKVQMLPLRKNANIVCSDALTTDWISIFHNRLRSNAMLYIIGNPPFQGGKKKTEQQNEAQLKAMPSMIDSKEVWKKQGSLDFVCAWYAKAAEIVRKRSAKTRFAFVSTNSIVQGEQNAPLWQPLLKHYKLHIDFAWRSFRWFNKADDMAHVHCVIIALSKKRGEQHLIFEVGKEPTIAENINNYLLPAENIFIWSRTKPLSNVPKINIGNKPIDNGNYIFTDEGKTEFLNKEPQAVPYFHPYYGADEFINNKPRWILWLGDCKTSGLTQLPECQKRIKAVKEFRLTRGAETRELAERPTHFHVENMPKSNYLLIPRHSSENRDYIPMGFMSPENLASDATLIAPGATLYHFGVLQSRIHMAWVNFVCGRIKSDFRYSSRVVYNCFPWPEDITDDQREAIERSAQSILDARQEDPEATLADYYDDHSKCMFDDLRNAHEKNNRAVEAAFGFSKNDTEYDIALELMRRSTKIAQKLDKPKKKKRSSKVNKNKCEKR